jgi:tetratricopeptide (TPR) repeat protein
MNRSIAILGIVGVLLYGTALWRLNGVPHAGVVQEMQVALPRFVQVAMAGGDRYLAANMATWRALVASTENMQKDNYVIQGRLQADAAWLNPSHEDNFYVAAAILPWFGELEAAQYVLRRASESRPYDWQPALYYAFNIYHFERDPARAAQWLQRAAPKIPSENDRYILEGIAVSWFEKGYQPATALKVIESMAATARSGGFKKYLLVRAERLRSLVTLQEAGERYRTRYGKRIRSLQDLVDARLIAAIPVDPFGFGFGVNAEGTPVLLTTPPKAKQ